MTNYIFKRTNIAKYYSNIFSFAEYQILNYEDYNHKINRKEYERDRD